MIHTWLAALIAGLVLSASSTAQSRTDLQSVPPWQFRWQPGQVHTYRVEHNTVAADVTANNKTESKTKLNLAKRWQVLDVDAKGVATLQLSVTALRLETTTPSGGTLLFDSQNADKSDPQMREQLGRFVGQTLAVLRIDPQGRVVEVKESKHGPASRFESELPFVFVLPEQGPQVGQTWERAYQITLEPPQGTGDKYQASQKYVCKAVTGNAATVAVTTLLKTMPESLLDRVPLLQLQPEGEVVFDLQAGRLHSASLRIEKELVGHQGEGSRYQFQSTYTEEYVGNK
jgi:hypothetical protein